MLFNSISFGIFLPIVFCIYWILARKSTELQNNILLVASYFFYGWWDWRLLFLLLFISVANYLSGIKIEKAQVSGRSRLWLAIGLIINIGTLGVFKYFNFFIDSFVDLVSLTGYHLPRSSVRIVLPLGISFYIFLSLSYIIDIYKKKIPADRNILNVLLTLSFFPIVLAGPIQRPATLLPQLTVQRHFDYSEVTDGLRQILWGLFVKIVIADNLAFYADDIFRNFSVYNGSMLFLGAVLYSIQIYADFSGYSDIAIGTAKLFGIKLMRNFAYPYFARDIVEFWKRWHISLTSWFRDYIFLPLSFSVSFKLKSDRMMYIKSDIFIYIVASSVTWFLTGMWHGANYTFLVWGLMHGLFLIVYRLQVKPRKKLFRKLGISNSNRIVILLESFVTLTVVLIAWVFFRSDSLGAATDYLGIMLSKSLFSMPVFTYSRKMLLVTVLLTMMFLIIEWFGREEQYAIAGLKTKYPAMMRWAVYYCLILVTFFFAGSGQKFIYFQF